MNYYNASDPIDILGLSRRSFNALCRAGYMQVGQLAGATKVQLFAINNLGRKSVDEILACIQSIQVFQDITIDDSASDILKQSPTRRVTLFRNAEGILCEDIPIEELGLSVRAINCLTGIDISFASQLIDSTLDDLLSISNMGKLTARQILETMQSLSFQAATVTADIPSLDAICEQFCRAVVDQLKQQLSFYTGAVYAELTAVYAEFTPEIEDACVDKLLERSDVWSRVFAVPLILDSMKAKILKTCSDARYGIHLGELRSNLPEHASSCGAFESVLEDLVADNLIYKTDEGMIACKHISIIDYANSVFLNKGNSFLLERLHGLTLDEIGKAHGNKSRERVRQVVQKHLAARPPVAEDYYAQVYQAYNWSKEDFMFAFNEAEETFNYLYIEYGRRATGDLADLCGDSNFPLAFRKAAERIIYKDCITIGNERIPVKRTELVEFILRTYCEEEMTFKEFLMLYDKLLDEWNLSDRSGLIINPGTYMNRLADSRKVLWKYGKKFRYYDTEQYDFTEFFDALALEQYQDIEYSTLKFFREYPELMKRYDVRDEYELHNLLRMICQPEQYPNILFKRMPNIEFGNAIRDEQVLDLLLQLAPISANDFAEAYEKEFGVLSQTVLANYVSCIDEYCFDSTYKIDLPALPPEQYSRIKELLTEDFYLIESIVQLYLRIFPEGSRKNINPYVLKTFGFKVYKGYVIGVNFLSAIDYFRSLLFVPDMLDLQEYSKKITCIGVFVSELHRLKSTLEIIEYAPLQFLNIRKLEAAGVTKEILSDYTDTIAKAIEKGRYFTVKSLRAEGFTHSLDLLGFDEWFYASLLTEDTRSFAYSRMGGTKVFRRGNTGFSMKDFIAHIIRRELSIDLNELASMLDREYGVRIDRWKITEVIKSSSLYYNPILEKVYIDYYVYFDEV